MFEDMFAQCLSEDMCTQYLRTHLTVFLSDVVILCLVSVCITMCELLSMSSVRCIITICGARCPCKVVSRVR